MVDTAQRIVRMEPPRRPERMVELDTMGAVGDAARPLSTAERLLQITGVRRMIVVAVRHRANDGVTVGEVGQAVHGRSGLWRHDEKPPCYLRVSARRVSVASDHVRDRRRDAARRRAETESVAAAVCHHRPVHVTVAQWLVLATSVVAAATVQGVVGFGSNFEVL